MLTGMVIDYLHNLVKVVVIREKTKWKRWLWELCVFSVERSGSTSSAARKNKKRTASAVPFLICVIRLPQLRPGLPGAEDSGDMEPQLSEHLRFWINIQALAEAVQNGGMSIPDGGNV